MARLHTMLLGVLAAILIAGCDAGPGPTTAPATGGAPADSLAPAGSPGPEGTDAASDPDAIVVDQLAGAWRVNPVLVDDARTAIASDACAAEARTTLGEAEANLPTSLVDARGEHLVTVIMADDLDAILCLAQFDDSGAVATVESVDRLSAAATVPVDGTAISVAAVIPLEDRSGGRMVAFGRLGAEAADAKVGFGDATVDLASKGDGWWAIWWPGSVRATGFSAVDNRDLVVGSATPPAGPVEARTSRATWWVDPAAPRPTTASTTIHALIHEEACASGKTPEGRIDAPSIDLEDGSVTVTIDIRRRVGDQDCQGNAPFPYTIRLPEPLGKRALIDGGTNPPRDATTLPLR